MRILAPVLSSFHDIDSLCFEFAKQKRNRDTISVLKREIDSFIKLREVLQLLPQLSEVLVTLQGEFWKRLHDIISRDDSRSHVQAMLIAVEDKISPDYQTGQLDIARLAYVNCVKEMEELVATYNQDLQISVKLHFTTSRGYHLKVPRKHASRLPSSFVQVLSSKGTVACTTAEIASLNRSQHEQVEEIFRLTVKQLCHLESLLVHHIGFLFQLSEEEFNTKFARPEFTKDDEAPEFALHGGRHPLIEELLKGECVANDCIFEPHGPRLAVVMGSNCCGKTTYLKQVALSVVMAQVGIQPPAETFKLPIFHRILTRLGTEDNLQGNASTFSFEMSEMAYILQVLEMNQGNTASLVLADELGRGTSTRDGLSLSWAVAEHIVKFPRTFSLFTTHFGAFRLFPRSEHLAILLEFSSSSIEDSDVDSIPAHKVKKVPSATNAPEYSADCSVLVYGSSENSYGLRLAEHCGIPHGVIDIATRMRVRLVESIQTSCTVQLSLGKKLQQVAAQGLSNDQLRNVLGEIQKNKTSTT